MTRLIPTACDDCGLASGLCICASSPELWTDTRVVILMHCRERQLTSNTARLACRALPHAEIRVRGERDKPTDMSGLKEPGRQPLLLYPSPDARPIGSELLESLPGPYLLIVPDGSWRQASRCVHREAALDGIPRVKLPPGPPSEYLLRREPNPEAVCTYEAIARALGEIEGSGIREQLEVFFRMKVERMLEARGKIPRKAGVR